MADAIEFLERRIRELTEARDACQRENSRLKSELDAARTRLLEREAGPFNGPREGRED